MKWCIKSISFKSIRNAFVVPFIVPIVIALVFVTITLMKGSQRAVDSVLREMSQSMLQQVKIQLDNLFTEANKLNILFILLFLVFGFWLARWITKPIVNLNASAKALTEGFFKHVNHENRQDELGQLTKSFNIMGSQLTDLVANLEMQVAERTRELEERNEALQELSFFDGLTCIPNRRRFDDFFNLAFSLSIRNSQPIAILMLDIDEFKKYNDTYGHLQGDECIKNIATV